MTDNNTLAQELEAMIYKGVEALGLWAYANREAILTAIRSQAPAYHETAIAEQLDEGAGFYRACSGCQESVDGCVSFKDYPYSKVFRCQPGAGCRECGGLGVIWDDNDYSDYGKDAPAHAPVGGDVAGLVRRVEYALDMTASAKERLHRRAHFTNHDLRTILAMAALQSPPAPEKDAVERALDDLQRAEADYRRAHDYHGDGSSEAGRAWDLMRRAGDRARAALAAMPPKVEAPAADAVAVERERCAKIIGAIQPDEDAAGCPATWDDFVQIAQCAIRAGDKT